MKYSLTICLTTSRPEPEIKWFLDSLRPQIKDNEDVRIIICSLFPVTVAPALNLRVIEPKPNIWQGKYKLTKDSYWAVANARNTCIAMCETEWVSFLDDRGVLSSNWLQCVREAMDGGYIMAGSYSKRQNMVVENGVILYQGILQAEDARIKSTRGLPIPCPGEWLFGCNLAMPLEWLLQVNGYEEKSNSVSFEDCLLGLTLSNNGFPMKFDPRPMLTEDRTPSKLGVPMKRSSKEKHPNDTSDKCHTLLKWTRTAKRSDNPYDIRELRIKIQAGGEFDIPNNPNEVDWFDSEPIKNFK